jgi:hypothetical protein
VSQFWQLLLVCQPWKPGQLPTHAFQSIPNSPPPFMFGPNYEIIAYFFIIIIIIIILEIHKRSKRNEC